MVTNSPSAGVRAHEPETYGSTESKAGREDNPARWNVSRRSGQPGGGSMRKVPWGGRCETGRVRRESREKRDPGALASGREVSRARTRRAAALPRVTRSPPSEGVPGPTPSPALWWRCPGGAGLRPSALAAVAPPRKGQPGGAASFNRVWPLAEIIMALIDAGLHLEVIRELRDVYWDSFPKVPAAMQGQIPRTFALRAPRSSAACR